MGLRLVASGLLVFAAISGAVLASGGCLYEEDFEAATSWEVAGTDEYWSAVQDGVYVVGLANKGSLLSFCQCGPFTTFRLRLTAEQTRGESSARCLIALQSQDIYGKGMLLIDISEESTRFWRYQEGSYTELPGSGAGESFRAEQDIEIVVSTDKVEVRLEGEVAASLEDVAPIPGDIGLGCASSDPGGAAFAFDDVQVFALADDARSGVAASAGSSEEAALEFSLSADGSGAFTSLEEAFIEAPAGATLRLGAGNYALSETISRWQSISIVGAGPTVTVITSSSSDECLAFGGAESDIVLEGCSFLRTSENPGDVVACAGRSVRALNCRFAGGVTDVLATGTLGAGLLVSGQCRAEISDCVAESNGMGYAIVGADGSTIESSVARKNRLSGMTWNRPGEARDSECVDNETAGIVVFGSGVRLAGNTCSRNRGLGITFAAGASGAAVDNTCEDNDTGIRIETTGVEVSGNQCRRNALGVHFLAPDTFGIQLTEEGPSVASGNVCDENGIGILVAGASAPEILGNELRRNTTCGIMIADTSDAHVTDNTCAGNAAGITCIGHVTATVAGNTCEDNTYNGIHIQDTATPDVHDNDCLRNGQAGIAIRNKSVPVVSENRCEGNEEFGILCAEETSATIRGNTCTGSAVSGIAVFDSATPEVLENDCSRNGDAGITVQDQSRPTVQGNVCEGNEGFGILCAGGSIATVEQNACSGNELPGIAYFDTAGGVARRNTCTGNHVGIFVAPGARVMLQDNTCTGNKAGQTLDTR